MTVNKAPWGHPDLPPEALHKLDTHLDEVMTKAEPKDGLMLTFANILSQVHRAGREGKHPEVGVVSDLICLMVKLGMYLGGLEAARFYLEALEKGDTPEDLFTKFGQKHFWTMIYDTHGAMFNTDIKTLPNLVEHAHRDTPAPLPDHLRELLKGTPYETKESPAPGNPGGVQSD